MVKLAFLIVTLAVGTWPFVGNPVVPTSLPVLVPISVDAFAPAPNPDATACTYLYQQVRANSEVAATPSPWPCPSGVSYKYIDTARLKCTGSTTQTAAYNYALTDETAFAHVYPNSVASANRYVTSGGGCGGSNKYYMNVGSPTYLSWLQNNVLNNRTQQYLPSQYAGWWFDTMEFEGDTAVGAPLTTSPNYTEYSNGSNPPGSSIQLGNSPYAESFSWMVAQAGMADAAWAAGNTSTINGAGPASSDIDACSVIAAGSCHAKGFPSFINDSFGPALTVFCNNLSSPNEEPFLFLEHPLLHEGSPPTNPGAYATTQTMVGEVNSWISLVTQHQTDNCKNMKFVDAEFLIGPAGTIVSGYQIRLLAMAMHWLTPNPLTQIPDRIIPAAQPIGGLDVSGEMPFVYDDTILPYSPQTTLSPLVWNGTSQSVGDGCGGAAGDTGGAVLLKVACNADNSSILMMKYRHCFINKVDKGPCAAIVNTSTADTANIVSSWFTVQGGDAIGTYHFEYSPSGGELSQVPYNGVNDPGCGTNCVAIPACSNVTNCQTPPPLSAQVSTFHGDGTDTIAPQSGMILLNQGS